MASSATAMTDKVVSTYSPPGKLRVPNWIDARVVKTQMEVSNTNGLAAHVDRSIRQSEHVAIN